MERKWSALCPGRFGPRERTSGTRGIGDFRVGLDVAAKSKILCPGRESNAGHPVRSVVVILRYGHKLPKSVGPYGQSCSCMLCDMFSSVLCSKFLMYLPL
jgi:hypothetical protein